MDTSFGFEEPGNFLVNKSSSLVPARSTGFYTQIFKTSVFILFAYIWVFFEGVGSLWVTLITSCYK